MQSKERINKWKIELHGLHMKLFSIFLITILGIVLSFIIVQTCSLRKQMFRDLEDDLKSTAQSISAVYSSNAYMSSIRTVINSGEYRVRTMMEDGKILIDTNDLSFYIHWPDITCDASTVSRLLNASETGYFVSLQEDPEQVQWVLYGQVLANWDGNKEILLITKNTQNMIEKMKRQVYLLIKVGLVIMAAAFFVCWFVSKIYLKPIEEITKRAASLSKGDYSVVFPKGSYKEIDTLSDVLNQSVEQFASYEQMRRDMIASLSHDMRTPLTMIKAYAEMIQTISGENREKRNEHLSVIIQQSDNLSAFITATLDLSKLQSGTAELHFEKYMLDRQVSTILERIRVCDQDGHEFQAFLEKDCQIEADYSRIEQILTNLLSNAMKYGKDPIEIHVRRKDGNILLDIIDHGDGIPEDKLHLIWTRYYMVNPYGKDSAGAGVGLSIVKEIAELHNLSYGVKSPNGYGGWFWFRFPEAQ